MAKPTYIKQKQQTEMAAGSESRPAALARQLREVRDRKDGLEAELTEVNKEIDRLSLELADEMENHGIDSFRVDGVGSVFIQIKNRPNVVDRPGMLVWLDEHGKTDMAPRAMHHARLESLVKEMLENGEELPPWVNNFQQKRAVIRRK